MKIVKEFFAIKIVLITLMLTVIIGLMGFLGVGILPQVGWVKVIAAESLPASDPSTGDYLFCQARGINFPPLGFPFTYFIWTNMTDAKPPHSISVPLWFIGACDVPSFINPFAFLGNFVLFLTGVHLFHRGKGKKEKSI